jgi:hypothetical protein
MPIKLGPLNKELQYLKNKLPQMGMFSTLDEAIQNAPQKQMTAEQWQQYLKPGMTVSRAGVNFPLKQEELQYANVPGILSQGFASSPLISREDLAAEVQAQRPSFGIAKSYQKTGDSTPELDLDPSRVRVSQPEYGDHAHIPGVENSYQEHITTSPDFGSFSSHFSPQDISWSRTTKHPVDQPGDVEGAQQKLLRLIEEIQSDRHEAAAAKVRVLNPDVQEQLRSVDLDPNQFNDPLMVQGFGDANTVEERRGYRTPEDERQVEGGMSAPSDLLMKPPDTPFKDPADYAGLELRKQLLNSVNQGDSYLGLTRGSDQVQRYEQGMGGGKGEGMSYIYDKVYPSALRKLARQYGAEVSDVPVKVGGGDLDTRPQTLVDFGEENPTDLLDRAHNEPEAFTRAQSLADDFERLRGELPEYDTHLNAVNQHIENGQQRDLTPREWEDIHDRFQSLHTIWNMAAAEAPETMGASSPPKTKTFPAMNITPEVAEKVRQAGVPLWSLAGATAAGLGARSNDASATPVEDASVQNANQGFASGGTVSGRTNMAGSLDPLALVVAAKQRHYAYKPLGSSNSTPILGADYTPSYQQGANPVQNPAGDASLRARGMQASPAAALAARYKPQSPTNPVEPTANGIPLPNFAEGGEVVGKAAKLLKDWLSKAEPAVTGPGAISTDPHLALLRSFGTRQQGNQLGTNDLNKLVSSTAAIPSERQLTASQTNAMVDPNSMAQKIRDAVIDPRHLDGLKGQDPSLDTLISGYTRAAVNGDVPDDLRSALANKLENIGQPPQAVAAQAQPTQAPAQGQPPPSGMADGGSVDDSSLKWLADAARKFGVSSMAPDRARVATGIAKQFYGLDSNGQPKLGGEAWTSSQHGTPPAILDELSAIPGGVVSLLNTINGKGPAGTSQMQSPKWSTDASDRLDKLDQKVKQTTGVGDAQTLPEHIEDAAGMLATPIPASKVAEEAPMLQRALEYFTPVRPPSLARYATDSTALGGASAGLDALASRLAAKRAAGASPVDPQIEDTAMENANAQ